MLDGNTGGVGWFIDDLQFTNTLVPTTCNHPPRAADDIASTVENNAVTVNVLANDSDPDGNPISVSAVTQPAHGTVTNNTTNVTYTPAASYFGNDSFTYTVSDGNGGTATATVTVTITAVNDAPVAVNDTATTVAETLVDIAVLSNDADIDGPSLSIDDVRVNEGNAGTKNATFTVSMTSSWPGPTAVTYTVQSGTATAGADFGGALQGTLNFAPGETKKEITIPIAGDSTFEATETVNVVIKSPGTTIRSRR